MPAPASTHESAARSLPAFAEALRYWLKLGCISFGGPAGQIALMHTELVERRRWISESHFLHALNFCMLLPGPEAQQLATYLGWRLHGWRGGVAAGALFVLPSVLILYALSWLFLLGAEVWWLAAFFHGMLPAVLAIVASALLRIARRALKTPALAGLAVAAFLAIFVLKASFVVIILTAALLGALGHRLAPTLFPAGNGHGQAHLDDLALPLPPAPAATWRRAGLVLAVCGALWWGPILAAGMWLGWESTLATQGLFFSKAALVTFGGAYAVLPYVAQQAVERFGWLTHAQMMGGLAFAETTPGPLIMVLQFVGFVGGWQHPGALAPWQAATLGALLTTWVTFLPSFLLVFLGAPHVEGLRTRPQLEAALGGITAAVVGVILNLAVWFALHTAWPKAGPDWFVIIAAVAAMLFHERWKAGVLPLLGTCGAAGVLWQMLAS
jgi:chromate transporter